METQSPKPTEKVVHVQFGQERPAAVEHEGQVLQDPWGRALRRLSESEALLFESWYRELKFVETQDQTITLRAPSKFIAQYIQSHHLKPLLGAVQLEFGRIQKVCLLG